MCTLFLRLALSLSSDTEQRLRVGAYSVRSVIEIYFFIAWPIFVLVVVTLQTLLPYS